MRRSYLFLLLLFLNQTIYAYEWGYLGTSSPANVNAGSMELQFQHRFYGSIADNPFGTVFGASGGANVLIGTRFAPVSALEFETSYIFANQEITLGGRWRHRFTSGVLSAGLAAHTWSRSFSERAWGAVASAAFEFDPLLTFLTPYTEICVNTDGWEVGGAFAIKATLPVGRGSIESVAFIAEVYPQLSSLFQGGDEPFSFPGIVAGIGVATPGHHFALVLSTSNQAGKRALHFRPETEGWYLGFNLHRKLYLY